MRSLIISRSVSLMLIAGVLALSSTTYADSVDDYVRLEMNRRHIPGVALDVVQNGKSVKLQGYGFANIELQSPVTPNTVFELASLTKQFTAAAIMLLVQDGRLSVDDTLGKIMHAPEPFSGITLRQLLSHTSGLPREGPLIPGRSYRDDVTEEDIWKTAMHVRLESLPGEKYRYSNLGFNLLGMIIEKVSGKSYSEFMESRIFGPLGMTSTSVNDLRTIIANRASGYYWEHGVYKNGEPTSPTTYYSSGSIVSSAADMEKWDAALSADRLISAQACSTMLSPTRISNGKSSNYGFGWAIGSVRGHHCVSHDGKLSGFRSYIIRFTEDHLSVVLLTNASSLDDPDRIARHIAQFYIPALKEDQPTPVAERPELLPLYSGRYEYANNQMLTVSVDDGRLKARLMENPPDDYRPISNTGFYCYDEDIQLTFVADLSGKVVAVKIKQDGSERTAPRIGGPVHERVPQSDPDPGFTARILDALDALSKGGKQLARVAGVTRGVRRDFISVHEFADIRSLTFISSEDISTRRIERHGSRVVRVNTYKFVTGTMTRYVLIYLTADNLMTDEDIVED